MNRIESVIDLVIGSGMFIAPRRVLLDRSADLKQSSPRSNDAGVGEEAQHKTAR
jgi:hypothetical protein